MTVKFSVAFPNLAVIFAGVLVVTDVVVTVKFALDKPVVMFTELGTVACEALLERLIVVVLEAVLLRLAVQVDVAGGVTLVGLQLREESTGTVG